LPEALTTKSAATAGLPSRAKAEAAARRLKDFIEILPRIDACDEPSPKRRHSH
jgi:hypothetical protein